MIQSPLTEEDIFKVALEIRSAEARAAYLRQACGADAALQERITALLDLAADQNSFLERPPAGYAPTVASAPISERPGDTIGPYKLMEQIGEGGFGLVFVAEQHEPVRRKVALKVIKPGMDTREVVARFEAERQALAMMDHPNIAKIYDAGMTGSHKDESGRMKDEGGTNGSSFSPHPSSLNCGRPYFVMELVRGVPITEYCDANQITPRQRLELFVNVCQAVQHAHQKGVIHRDLKPNNILVAPHDGVPVVKVIDFGVAKALGQQLTDKTIYTRFAQMIGTPLYMSPEQAEINALDVDTRADVYSLGVLLYELLTGTTPFDKKRLASAAFDEIRRIIREEEPPKPSTRMSQARPSGCGSGGCGSAKGGTTAAGVALQAPPATLVVPRWNELDWIVMKALEKDRTRRYETASSFAADIGRYLRDEPVTACPPSLSYRLSKFTRRYKAPLSIAAAFLALLLAGTSITTWQAIRAKQAEAIALASERKARAAAEAAEQAKVAETSERKSAEAQRDRAVKAEQQALTAEQEAKAAAKTAEEERAVATAVNDFVRRDLLGQVSRSGQVDAGFQPDPDIKVRTLLDRASESVAERFKDQPRVEAEIRMTIGFAYQQLLSSERLAVNKTPVDQRRNMKAAAEKHITRALELFEGVLGENDQRTLAAVYQVAAMYSNFKEYDKAEPYFRRNLEGRRRRLGADSPSLLPAMNNLAFVYGQMGRVEEAVQMYQDALQQARRMSAASPSEVQTLARDTAGIMHNLGGYYLKLKRYAEAEPLLRAALDARRQALGNKADGPKSGHNLSVCYYYLGRYAEAEVLQRKSLEVVRSRYGEDSPEAAEKIDFLAEILKKQHKFAEVDELLSQQVVTARKQSGDQSIAVVTALVALATSQLEQQRHADAEPLLREALAIREKLSPDQRFNVQSLLGASLAGKGKHAEAEPLLISGYEGIKARLNRLVAAQPGLPGDSPLKRNLVPANKRLAQFYEQLDRPAEAARWRKDLNEFKPLIFAAGQPVAEQPAVPPIEQPAGEFPEQL